MSMGLFFPLMREQCGGHDYVYNNKRFIFCPVFLYNQELVLLKFMCLEAFTVTEFNKIFLGSHLKACKFSSVSGTDPSLKCQRTFTPSCSSQPEKILLKAVEIDWIQVNGATMKIVL